MMAHYDPLQVTQTLSLGPQEYDYFALQKLGILERLPCSIKILLESVLRNYDGFAFTDEHIQQLVDWQPKQSERAEIAYKPARVILQDFTGVPAVVDLAAMRDALARLGGDPKKINPLLPVNLVVDHSVQIDEFGCSEALSKNEQKEFERNEERYRFLKWGTQAFANFKVVPPGFGIIHQINLEYLASVTMTAQHGARTLVFPDTCVGTDSHTPMVNGLGVVAWGVGGIEAEAVMLGQPIYMLVPDVVGIKLVGKIAAGVTATDVVLSVTNMLRQHGVVGKFVEFYGSGLTHLSLADRALISNMSPEHACTVTYFPVDEETLKYMELTGRPRDLVALTRDYYTAQGLFRTDATPDPEFSSVLELDLGAIKPCLSGPKRPHDRVFLQDLKTSFQKSLSTPTNERGFGLDAQQLQSQATVNCEQKSYSLSHGAVVIASITSCTNTSNPAVMIGAGLLARNAVARGLNVPEYVKTSLAPGSLVVTRYLQDAGLLEDLEKLGFHVTAYGCATCIGNSGPLPEPVVEAIDAGDLVACAVLSGNRNFEGRISPHVRANYLASPALVVAFALAGRMDRDLTAEPLGHASDGTPIFLKDIWPDQQEIDAMVAQYVQREQFLQTYEQVWDANERWNAIAVQPTELYSWQPESTYLQSPPFFADMKLETGTIAPITNARCLAVFGDSITTDHISPAGTIAPPSPAGQYLAEHGVPVAEFNSYGSRRGNDRVMARGTFANIRLKNLLVPGSEGGVTKHFPSNEQLSIYEAAMRYREQQVPLVILAGKEYGSGSSRDWAAKGPALLGVKAVIAESYERIHRSNLVGMGILPLQFLPGQNVVSLGLTGQEVWHIPITDQMQPGQTLTVAAASSHGGAISFDVIVRVDTPVEVEYMRNGGILQTVLRNLAQQE